MSSSTNSITRQAMAIPIIVFRQNYCNCWARLSTFRNLLIMQLVFAHGFARVDPERYLLTHHVIGVKGGHEFVNFSKGFSCLLSIAQKLGFLRHFIQAVFRRNPKYFAKYFYGSCTRHQNSVYLIIKLSK